MGVGELARDREAEPGTGGAPGNKRLEQVIAELGCHAWAGIGDGEAEPGALRGRTDFDPPAGGGVPHCIHQEILQDATDDFRVEKPAR